MLLGKRPRPHIRRTTSMTGITSNFDILDSNHHSDNHNDQDHQDYHKPAHVITNSNYVTSNHGFVSNSNNSSNYYDDHGRFLASMVLSPRNMQHQRSGSSSGGFAIEPANFLRTCGLCRRRLASGRDIYMYRGDTGFCSQECREKRMEQDERKEKYKEVVMATKREEHSSTNSNTSSKGHTLATA